MSRVLLLGIAWVAMSAAATAASIPGTADIRGENEVPAVDTDAFGTGVFDLDTDTNVLSYEVLYTEILLDGTESAAHVHVGAPGVIGPVVFLLPLGEYKTGSVDLDDVATDLGVPVGDLIADYSANLWYVNIHTMPTYPDGEIRGQIMTIVPEPASIAIAAAGLVSLVLLRKRS